MEIVCVRHGRTAWNAERRFQGHADVPLDDEGRAQAQALAAYLAPERFDVALSSDLGRAFATATAIGDACGVAVEPDPRLREMRFGAWEGLTWDEIVARTPGLATEHEAAPKFYVPAGGESFEELCERLRPVLAELTARLEPNGRALIVSHAGVMHGFMRIALAPDANDALGVRLVPAAILRLRGDGTLPWRLITVNETAPPLADSATPLP